MKRYYPDELENAHENYEAANITFRKDVIAQIGLLFISVLTKFCPQTSPLKEPLSYALYFVSPTALSTKIGIAAYQTIANLVDGRKGKILGVLVGYCTIIKLGPHLIESWMNKRISMPEENPKKPVQNDDSSDETSQ